MGYEMVIGPCFGCGKTFGYNADYVPSIRVEGVKQPVCRSCVDRVNPVRIANGLDPIIPHPEAYEAREV